ncbi:MAG: ribokinase [Bacteroidales bacterium]|nr:ribokinase [Bacteroidales bacterium]MBN2699089.1 ribokinase [Bacteroidales bacterium]
MEKQVVTIIGSYNVGFFFKGKSLPLLGETIIGDKFIEGGGGKGSNQAIAAAVLGADTRFICTLGADKYGIDALRMYRGKGINIDFIRFEPCIHSGMSVVIIDDRGNNIISVVPGANLLLNEKDIDNAVELIEKSFIVGFQLENRHETVFYGIKKARSLGVKTFLDPAPAKKLPDDLYKYIDIIKPNETEATILTDIQVGDIESAAEAGKWFLNRGVRTAIITLGHQGSVLVTEGLTRHFPALKVEAVDTTGAGDIFSGGLLASLVKNKSMEESIEYATCAAGIATTVLGVIESIPSPEEVLKMMELKNC